MAQPEATIPNWDQIHGLLNTNIEEIAEEYKALHVTIAELEAEEQSLKERLVTLVEPVALKVRCAGVVISKSKGRKTLNKELLAKAGVDPALIAQGYKEGAPSWRVTVEAGSGEGTDG